MNNASKAKRWIVRGIVLAGLCAMLPVAAVGQQADPPLNVDFSSPDDAESLLVRTISPYYVRQLDGEHEVRDGFYTVRNGIRVTRQQVVGDELTFSCEIRVRPLPFMDAYHGYVGVVDFRGVETYLVGWMGEGDYVSYHMSGRIERARETFFKQQEHTDYKGRVSYTAITEREEKPQWHRLVFTWKDGKVTGTLDGETLGERELKLFDGEGLGLTFFAWHANVDIRNMTLTGGAGTKLKSRIMPRDRFVTPHYKFEPIPADHPMVKPVEYEPCEKPEPLTAPLRAYGYDERTVVGIAGEMADFAERWRHTGDANCREMFLRRLAVLKAHQKPSGAFWTGGWVDAYKYHMWKISLSLDTALKMTGDPRVREVAAKVADWAVNNADMSYNMNYNTTPVNLAKWYEVTGDEKYLDAAWPVARDGILAWQQYQGTWAGHNSHVWYSGIGMRTMSYLALAMPKDYPAYDELTGGLRAATNQVILAQAPSGGLYETWDRLESEYNVRVDRVHPKPSAFTPANAIRLCKVFDNHPAVLNFTYGLYRWVNEQFNWTFAPHELPGASAPELPPMPGETASAPLPETVTKPPEVIAAETDVEPIRVGAAYLPSSGEIMLAAGANPDAGEKLEKPVTIGYRITVWGSDERILQGNIRCPVEGEQTLRLEPKAPLGEGKYMVEFSFRRPDGQPRNWTRHFYKRDWEWLGNDLGETQAVPAPWTPVEVAGRSVKVYGRTYALSPLGLPESIDNQGDEMLAAPVTLTATADGAPLDLSGGEGEFTDTTGARAVYAADASAGALKVSVETAVEYDGLAIVDLRISGGKSAKLDGLTLQVPVRRKLAKFYRVWSERGNVFGETDAEDDPIFSSGRDLDPNTPAKVAGTFVPYVYLGNPDGGLAWLADSDRGYAVDDDRPIVRIVGDDGAATLVVRMIDRPVASDAERHIRFCLQAVPVKPMPAEWRKITFVSDGGVDSPMLINCYGSPHWSKGLNRIVRVDWNDRGLADIRRQIAAEGSGEVGKASIWTQYWPVNTLNGATPQYENFRVEWGGSIYHDYDPGEFVPTAKPNQYGSRHPLDEKLGHSPSALSPSMIDYRVWAAGRLMLHTAGVFAVSASPTARYLPAGGFGYVRADGIRQPTYDLLARRELFRRIYMLSHQMDKPTCYTVIAGWEATLPTMGAYALASKQGVTLTRKHWDRPAWMHTVMRAQPVGAVPATGTIWNHIGERGSREMLAVALSNDIRGFEMEDMEMATEADNALQGFGIGAGDCRFHPYWREHGLAETDSPTTSVSAYVRPTRALLIVANRSESPTVAVRPNLQKLGVAATYLDAERGTPLSADAQGRLELEIPPYQYRAIWVGEPDPEGFPLSAD